MLQACRQALVDLKFAKDNEALLRAQVEELKKVNGAQTEQIVRLETSIAKYEQAITARTQAEALVSELRSNYEKQIAVAEKLLAIEQHKASFWRTTARFGMFAAFVLGAAVSYAVTK